MVQEIPFASIPEGVSFGLLNFLLVSYRDPDPPAIKNINE